MKSVKVVCLNQEKKAKRLVNLLKAENEINKKKTDKIESIKTARRTLEDVKKDLDTDKIKDNDLKIILRKGFESLERLIESR